MRKTFVVLWCALAGCSIIPDDAFEKSPEASLTEITITSNLGTSSDPENDPMPPSTTLTGIATTSGNTTTIEWSGPLNPFPYPVPVKSTKYQVDESGRLSGVTITLEDERTQTEVITYNEEGRYNQLIVSAADSTSTYSFFYNEVGVVDTIRKVMIRTGKAPKPGLYYLDGEGGMQYSGVYPYDAGALIQKEFFGCTGPWNPLPNTVNGFSITVDDWGYLNTQTVYKTDEGYRAALSEGYITKDVSVLTEKTIEKRVDFYQASGTSCGRPAAFVNHYFLYPQLYADLKYLVLATTIDATRSVGITPGQLDDIHNIDIKYQYTYAE
jgi:hypothetical protein